MIVPPRLFRAVGRAIVRAYKRAVRPWRCPHGHADWTSCIDCWQERGQ